MLYAQIIEFYGTHVRLTSARSHQIVISESEQVQRLQRSVERLKKLTLKYRKAETVQQALFHIAEKSSSVENLDQLFREIHHIIGQLMVARNFFVCTYDFEHKYLDFLYIVDEYDTVETFSKLPSEKVANGLTGYVLKTKKSLLITGEDIRSMEQQGLIDVVGTPPVDWLGVPLLVGDVVWGAIVVQSYTREVRYTEEDRELLMFVSQHIANALERFKHREWMQTEIEHQTAELRFANEHLLKEMTNREQAEMQTRIMYVISELTNSTEDIQDFYEALHEQVNNLLIADNFYVALLTDNNQQLYFPYYKDISEGRAKPRRFGFGLTEYAMRQKKPILIDRALYASLLEKGELAAHTMQESRPHQWLGAPLSLDGEVFGVLAVQTYDEGLEYDAEDVELLAFVSQHVAIAIERRRKAEQLSRANVLLEKRVAERTQALVEEIERRKQVEEKLYHDAHHDPLTGLPNRAMLIDRLKHALALQKRRKQEFFAVLYIDLDRFKIINDTLGHAAGDKFLLETSRRLSKTIREYDTLARLGGDEFVILLDRIESLEDAEYVASRIISVMKEVFVLEGQELFSGASVGIATYSGPEDTVGRLLRDADAAMYQAKKTGRGKYVVFDEGIRSDLVAIVNQESALRQAQVNQDFILWFQPVVCFKTKAVVANELFLRWQREEEMISPLHFLKVAERSGIIIELDLWVLEQACQMIQQHLSLGLPIPPFHINMSTQHLRDSHQVKALIQILNTHQVPENKVYLEFGEMDLMNEHAKRVLMSLRALKAAGFGLTIDDFGRTSAPIQLLYRFPFNHIKLYYRFVIQASKKEKPKAIMKHVVGMCEDLGIEVSSKGIEKQSQFRALQSLGISKGQGYLLVESEYLTDEHQAGKRPLHGAYTSTR